MSRKKKIIKDVIKLTSARYIAQGIGLFTAIAMRKFLGPFYMGIWSLLKVFLGYSSYLMIGVTDGAAYRIPFYAGQGNKQAEEEAKNTAFSFLLIISTLTSIGLLVTAFFLRDKFPTVTIVGLCFLSVYVMVERICGYYQILLRAEQNFGVLSKSIVFDAVANLILILLLVSSFKIYGLYVAAVLVGVLNTIFMHVLAKYSIKIRFNKEKFIEMIKIGFPLIIGGLLNWVLLSLDRIMIGKMIGIAFVGFYSIPLMARSYVGQISSFGTVLRPYLMESYGEEETVENIKKYVITPPIICAYTVPIVLGIIFIGSPLLVQTILPKFTPGVLALQILLLGMFFDVCQGPAIHFIVSIKKQVKMIPFGVCVLVLNFIGNYMLIKAGYGIYGVAAATSFVAFLLFICLQGYAMKHFANLKEIFIFFTDIIGPLLYSVVVVLVLQRLIVIRNPFIETLVRLCLFGVFSIPLLVRINNKTGIMRHLIEIVQERIREKNIFDRKR